MVSAVTRGTLPKGPQTTHSRSAQVQYALQQGRLPPTVRACTTAGWPAGLPLRMAVLRPWDLGDFSRESVSRGPEHLLSLFLGREAFPAPFRMKRESLYFYDNGPCTKAKGRWTCHATLDIRGGRRLLCVCVGMNMYVKAGRFSTTRWRQQQGPGSGHTEPSPPLCQGGCLTASFCPGFLVCCFFLGTFNLVGRQQHG